MWVLGLILAAIVYSKISEIAGTKVVQALVLAVYDPESVLTTESLDEFLKRISAVFPDALMLKEDVDDVSEDGETVLYVLEYAVGTSLTQRSFALLGGGGDTPGERVFLRLNRSNNPVDILRRKP